MYGVRLVYKDVCKKVFEVYNKMFYVDTDSVEIAKRIALHGVGVHMVDHGVDLYSVELFKESKEIAVYNLSSHRWEEIKGESKDVDISDGKFVK